MVTAICVLILQRVLILLYVFSYYYIVGAGKKARFFLWSCQAQRACDDSPFSMPLSREKKEKKEQRAC